MYNRMFHTSFVSLLLSTATLKKQPHPLAVQQSSGQYYKIDGGYSYLITIASCACFENNATPIAMPPGLLLLS